jgi:EAL and modified HD-GYP domain-containing signal transduction protein
MSQLFLRNYAFAYQPILSKIQCRVAVELMYQSTDMLDAGVMDPAEATANAIINAILHAGSERSHFFVSIGDNLLMSDMLALLPRNQTTLEIREASPIRNAMVVERCQQLKSKGYKIALDGFVALSDELATLLDIVDVVKVDLSLVDRDSLPTLVEQLRKWPVKLLAKKVESAEDFELCQQLEFDLFQGYYFAKPTIVIGRRPDPAKLDILQLLGQINNDVDDSVLELTFKRNPGLSYHLLRLINTVAFGQRARVDSIHQALMLLGRRQLNRWLQMLLFTHGGGAGLSSPLLELAVRRGKLMELMAVQKVQQQGAFHEQSYMTGMLSLTDALLGVPMAEIVDSLNLGREIRVALLSRDGQLGNMLNLCERLETADFDGANEIAAQLGIPAEAIMIAQDEAIAWASKISETETD